MQDPNQKPPIQDRFKPDIRLRLENLRRQNKFQVPNKPPLQNLYTKQNLSTTNISPSCILSPIIELPLALTKNVDEGFLITLSKISSLFSTNSSAGLGNPAETVDMAIGSLYLLIYTSIPYGILGILL
jgi:hypothetical protein